MKERFWLKPLAVLLGILAWFYVNIMSTTPITREYKVKISYLNKDDSKNYKVIPEAPEVKIKVKGPRGVFIQTKVEESTFASVDLINCHGGKLTLPVNVIFPSTSNLQILSKEPAQLVINAVKMASKNINVKVNVTRSVPDGYLSGEPSVTPDFLTVTAPKDIIDTIQECRIDLDLEDVKRSISEYRTAHIIYANGLIESDLRGKLITIDNNNVKLDLVVKEGYPEKTVSVKPELVNRPPEGYKLESYTINPDKVVITGSSKIIDKIDSLSLEQIDLGTIIGSTDIQSKVKLPKGVNIVGNNNISMSIKYSDVLLTKVIPNLPLEITHDEEQLIECDVSTYTLELEGYLSDINSIKQDELKNIVFAKGLSSGTHNIKLEIPYGFSKSVKVKSITPEYIPVTIRLLEKVNIEKEEKISEEVPVAEASESVNLPPNESIKDEKSLNITSNTVLLIEDEVKLLPLPAISTS